MEVHLTPDQEAYLATLVDTARDDSKNEAIRDSVRLLISREQLKEQLEVGIHQADRGKVITHGSVFAALPASVTEIQRANSRS